MKKSVLRLIAVLAVLALAFAYGFVSHWKELFPYQVLRNTQLTLNALLEKPQEPPMPKNVEFWDESGNHGPLYRKLSPRSGTENVFILGNEHTYRDARTGQAYLAWIVDRDGNVLHAWRDSGEIWSPLDKRDALKDEWQSYPVGAHLFPNGDILVSYHGVDLFPISLGLAKFDSNSQLIWKRDGFYHHWFSVGPRGEIYVPQTVVGTSPLQIDDHDKFIVCNQGQFSYDSLAVLDGTGNKIREIDLLTSLVNSDLTGILNSNRRHHTRIETCDPFHLNDVQVLSEDQAGDFPLFAAGDLLLSFRSLNGIGVLDPSTELFKWFYVGAPQHQHSPRFHRNDRVLVFDNYGGRISQGTSRVLSIEVASRHVDTLVPRPGAKLLTRELFSGTAGHLDVDASGDRVLVASTRQGLLWEIDVETGDALWEFVNTHPVDGRAGRISVLTAKYVDEIAFPLNGGRPD